MTAQPSAQRRARIVLLIVAMILPTATLILLGSLWLWQHGYVLHWAVASCLAVVAIYALERRLMGPLPAEAPASDPSERLGDASWSPQQDEAWADVLKLAEAVKPERINSRDAALALALEAIETVAKRLHPERSDPLLQFTVPEALAVTEQASHNMRTFVSSSLPFGDRITVAQLLWLYRWRWSLGLAEKGYDLWRLVRLINPVSAATQELRERFTRQIYDMGRQHVTQRLARAYVREVGRAAIDLYGGNLRVAVGDVSPHVSAVSRRSLAEAAIRDAEPVRILIAGQTGVGKSSLVNALARAVEAGVDTLPLTKQFTAYKLTREGMPAALLIDSPGLASDQMIAGLTAEADDCDMLVWVSSAARAARDIDRRALQAIRANFAASPHRRAPPMLLVLSHIDALRPFNEWAPPYDLNTPANGKAATIRAAMEAAGTELGFPMSAVVPVRIDQPTTAYNIDALWSQIIALLPDAKRARLLRMLDEFRNAPAWRNVWSQAASAGRVIGETFLTRSRDP